MKPSAILASDLHIRDSIPECRTDSFMDAQARKHLWLRELQEQHQCPVLVPGDVFDHWKPAPWLIRWAFRHLSNGIIAIPGQHDLPQHNLENIDRAGIEVLAEADKITLLCPERGLTYTEEFKVYGFPWGKEIRGLTSTRKTSIPKVALIHHLVYKGRPPFPGAENIGGTGKEILKRMTGFDLVVSGDNHQSFVERYEGRLLVNPGSFLRNTAAQIEHQPKVFLWYAETNEVEEVLVPIEKGVVSREHIEVTKERDQRLEAFVEKLNKDVEISLSFTDNMERHIAKNKVSKAVSNIIRRAIGI